MKFVFRTVVDSSFFEANRFVKTLFYCLTIYFDQIDKLETSNTFLFVFIGFSNYGSKTVMVKLDISFGKLLKRVNKKKNPKIQSPTERPFYLRARNQMSLCQSFSWFGQGE